MASEIAKALQFSTVVKNIFGLCPYNLHPGSNNLSEMVQMSWLSSHLPFLGIPVVLFLFIWGMWINYMNTIQAGHSTLFDEDTFGAGADSGSIVFIALQLSFLSTIITYILTLLITFWNRHTWTEIMNKYLSIIETMDKEYEVKCDYNRAKWILNSMAISIVGYVFILVVFFAAVINEPENKIILPICTFIQMTTIYMCTYDMIVMMQLLTTIFRLIRKISGRKYKNSLVMAFFDTLDLLEVVSKTYGLRESINIGNEFLTIIAQISYIVYQVLSIGAFSFVVIIFGVISAAPKIAKLWILAYYGTRLTEEIKDTVGVVEAEIDALELDTFDTATISLHMVHYRDFCCISTNHLFVINLSMMYGIVATTCSYFLILVQFKAEEEIH